MKRKRRKKWQWVYCKLCHDWFEVPPHRLKTVKYCGIKCAQKAKAKLASESRRGSGDGRYVRQSGRRQHRIVAEQKLGRPMTPNEVVHHLDGDGDLGEVGDSVSGYRVVRRDDEADLVIEAVFENMDIKKEVFGKLDKKRIRLDITQWQASNSAFLSTL